MRRGGVLALLLAILTGGCSLLVVPPQAEFDVRPPVVYAGDRVDLDAGASTGDLVDYRWDVAGATEHGRVLTTTFLRPGVYAVRLTVEDNLGRLAQREREIMVYARSGTRLFTESFSDGETALGRWPLDPIWAVPDESRITAAIGDTGYALLVDSAPETYHRRAVRLELPPLRTGQKLVFSVRVLPLRTQGQHGFIVAPGRTSMALPAAGLPYFSFSSTGGGCSLREPSAAGGEVGHFVPYMPSAIEWHTYTLSYAEAGYSLSIDGAEWGGGSLDADFTAGGESWLVLGDESLTDACQTYFDDVLVSVEE